MNKLSAWFGFRNEYVMYLSAKKIYEEVVANDPSLRDPDEIIKKEQDEFDDWVKEFVANTNAHSNKEQPNKEVSENKESDQDAKESLTSPYKIANESLETGENQSLLKNVD